LKTSSLSILKSLNCIGVDTSKDVRASTNTYIGISLLSKTAKSSFCQRTNDVKSLLRSSRSWHSKWLGVTLVGSRVQTEALASTPCRVECWTVCKFRISSSPSTVKKICTTNTWCYSQLDVRNWHTETITLICSIKL